MNSSWTSLNPPSSLSTSKGNQASSLEEEKHFLNLLKTIERHTKCSFDDELTVQSSSIEKAKETVLETLSSMENLYQRRGLLEYDSERAHDMQSTINDQSLSNNNGGSGKKRRRGAGGSGSSGSIASLFGTNGGNTKTSIGKETYVLSNLCRVLIPALSSSSSSSSSSQYKDMSLNYPPEIIYATCNVLIAICTHCKNNLPSSTATVEYSLLVSISSQVLSGLSKTIHLVMASLEKIENDQHYSTSIKTLSACCNCAALLIALSGTQLSRNVKVMEGVKDAAETLLWSDMSKGGVCDEQIISFNKDSAAGLFASIPLAGNSNSVPPYNLWMNQLLSVCKELYSTLSIFCPYLRRTSVRKNNKKSSDSTAKLKWIEASKLEDMPQAERIKVLSMRLDTYVTIILSFLKMERFDRINFGITCMLPMKTLMIIIEQMLSFAPLTENKYLSTKPSLRNISVEGGLLSTNAAMMIANVVKYQGHLLIQTLSSLLTNSSLVYGKQMIDISLSSLQSSTSNTLRLVVDPVSFSEKNGNKKWLHSSVSLRSMAVQTFSHVMQRIGSNAIVSQKDAVVKGLVYIVGFILEQISDDNIDAEREVENEHWGTELERAKLVETCVQSLAGCISIFGGYLPLQNREMIESVTVTCLEHACSEGNGSVYCSNPTTKLSILNLGISCVSTPWQDGCGSTIIDIMKNTSSFLRFDRDHAVSCMAYTAFNLCNSILTSRAPPLVIVKRVKDVEAINHSMIPSFSKEAIEDSIMSVRENIVREKREIEMSRNKVNKEILEKRDVDINFGIPKTKVINEVELEANPPSHNVVKEVQMETNPLSYNEVSIHQESSEKGYAAEATVVKQSELSEVARINNSKKKPQENEIDNININEFENDDQKEDLGESKNTISMHSDGEEESDLDDDFPMIVDCDPDEEDME